MLTTYILFVCVSVNLYLITLVCYVVECVLRGGVCVTWWSVCYVVECVLRGGVCDVVGCVMLQTSALKCCRHQP